MPIGCGLHFNELTQVFLSKTPVELEISEELKYLFYSI